MKIETKFYLLTFYKFVDIENPKEEVREMRQFCKDNGMKGRIYISEEGINAQLTANIGQTKALKLYLNSNKFFTDIPDIDDKATEVDNHKFPKMIVRYRPEIVTLGKVYPSERIRNSAFKISPDELKDIFDNKKEKDYIILDMRNNYEYKLGHFKGAIPAGTINFRDLPDVIDKYKENLGQKEVIMYCTGGIRCEKVAAFLEDKGLPGVKQLDGGVVKYVNKFNDGNWLGNLYTFDDRVSTQIGDEKTHTIISECHFTGAKAENYYNCRYGPCNAQIIAKPKEYRKHMGFCSHQCADNAYHDLLIRDVEWDSLNYKELRGKVKQDENNLEQVRKTIQIHLRKSLAGVKFNHDKPIEEKVIIPEIE